ncbi:hypothetical protein BRADI_3g20683v3 [Brachypodium distachyon]|uniref:Uncharacterized protein n=1 Tax=Brachypodium distachyon TaxID=15368 RepID=A0A2K2CYI2_BRADI|nr:hypothetical protein BRADI_3g20683v3 [Brachypodium distachyon]
MEGAGMAKTLTTADRRAINWSVSGGMHISCDNYQTVLKEIERKKQ